MAKAKSSGQSQGPSTSNNNNNSRPHPRPGPSNKSNHHNSNSRSHPYHHNGHGTGRGQPSASGSGSGTKNPSSSTSQVTGSMSASGSGSEFVGMHGNGGGGGEGGGVGGQGGGSGGDANGKGVMKAKGEEDDASGKSGEEKDGSITVKSCLNTDSLDKPAYKHCRISIREFARQSHPFHHLAPSEITNLSKQEKNFIKKAFHAARSQLKASHARGDVVAGRAKTLETLGLGEEDGVLDSGGKAIADEVGAGSSGVRRTVEGEIIEDEVEDAIPARDEVAGGVNPDVAVRDLKDLSAFQIALLKRNEWICPAGMSDAAQQILTLAKGALNKPGHVLRAGETYRDRPNPKICKVIQWSPPGMDVPLQGRSGGSQTYWSYEIEVKDANRHVVTVEIILADDILPAAMLHESIRMSFGGGGGGGGGGTMIIRNGKKVAFLDPEIEEMATATAGLWKLLNKHVNASSLPVLLRRVPVVKPSFQKIALLALCRLEEAYIAVLLHMRAVERKYPMTFQQALLISAPTKMEQKPMREGVEQSADAEEGEAIDVAAARALGRHSTELISKGFKLEELFASISAFFESNEGLKEALVFGDIAKYLRPYLDHGPTFPAYIEATAEVPKHLMKKDLPEKHWGDFGEGLFGAPQLDETGVVSDVWAADHADRYFDFVGIPEVLRIAGSGSWLESLAAASGPDIKETDTMRLDQAVHILGIDKGDDNQQKLLLYGLQLSNPSAESSSPSATQKALSKLLQVVIPSVGNSAWKSGAICRLHAERNAEGKRKFSRPDVGRILEVTYRPGYMVRPAKDMELFEYLEVDEAVDEGECMDEEALEQRKKEQEERQEKADKQLLGKLKFFSGSHSLVTYGTSTHHEIRKLHFAISPPVPDSAPKLNPDADALSKKKAKQSKGPAAGITPKMIDKGKKGKRAGGA